VVAGLSPSALVRVLDELLWTLRREGFPISTAEAIDVTRAVEAVGMEHRALVREAVASLVVQRARDRTRFDAAFEAFFSGHRGTLWERLNARGFEERELSALRALLAQLASGGLDSVGSLDTLLERGAELDRLLALANVAPAIDAHSGPQLGFQMHRLLGRIGSGRARQALGVLRARLVDALGARGAALADALADELEASDESVRAYVRRTHEARVAELERERRERRIETSPFASLTDTEIDEVRRAVRRFAERLRVASRVRRRHAMRGRIDPHRTLRLAFRTGGVPFTVARKDRRRDRPKLVLLCDISDSVRAAACFLLEFAYAAQELFERTRSFVFVSDLRETTRLFSREPVSVAIAEAWRGSVGHAGDNSNYGRMLRTFQERHLRDLDRRTTVVVLGDGRTNYHDAALEVLDRIRERARALIWLCTEPRGLWGQGDSAMARYAPRCTGVYEVARAADLERAARVLMIARETVR
jgi:uncharacterized protein with von Willebrand factor type A (vWA) domain